MGGRGSFTQPLVLSSRVFHLLPSPRPPAGMNERRGTRRQGGKRLRLNDPPPHLLPASRHSLMIRSTSHYVHSVSRTEGEGSGKERNEMWGGDKVVCLSRLIHPRFI